MRELSGYCLEEKEGRYLTFDIFTQTKLVRHAFTTRRGGVSQRGFSSLNLGFHVGDEEANVQENHQRICAALGVQTGQVVAGHQVHGTEVQVVDASHQGGAYNPSLALPDTDGLVTSQAGVMLASYHADCTPVMLLDPVSRAIGLVHAGWKGTVGKIAAQGIAHMKAAFGSNPRDCLAVVGPSIGPCCYQVGPLVLAQVQEQYEDWPVLVTEDGLEKWRLNLWKANRMALEEAGLLPEHIVESGLCTACHLDLFFSYRAQSGVCGRMASLFMLE